VVPFFTALAPKERPIFAQVPLNRSLAHAMASLSSSPRMRSAAQRGLRPTISRMSAARVVGGRPDRESDAARTRGILRDANEEWARAG